MSAKTPAPVKRSQRIRKVYDRNKLPQIAKPVRARKPQAAKQPQSAVPSLSVASYSNLRRCGLCSLGFPSADECALHIINVHLLDLQLCGKCSRAFDSLKQLKMHLERHKRRSYNIFSCAHCTVHFANVQSPFLLERHEFEKHENAKPGILLNRYLPYLSSHLNMNFERFVEVLRCRSLNYVCRLCLYKSTELSEYIEHLKLKCKKKQKYVCNKCTSVYTHYKAFVQHLQTKSKCSTSDYLPSLLPKAQKYFRCRNCPKKVGYFKSKAERDAHSKLCNRLICVKCSLMFQSIDDYNEHHASAHKDSLNIHNCPYCRMEFISKTLLDRHTKQHERYSCLECGKKFRTPKPLLAHIKTAHPTAEPYRCVPCDVSFKEGLHFKTHIVQHKQKGLVNFDENFIVTFTFVSGTSTGGENEDGSGAKEGGSGENGGGSGENEGGSGENEMAMKKDKKGVDEDGSEKLDSSREDNEEGERRRPLRNRNHPKKLMTLSRITRLQRIRHFQCKICNKQALNQKSYNRHVLLHLRQGAKQCVYCARILPDKQQHDQHVRTEHGRTQPANKLHQFLKERAERKLAALNASRRSLAQRRKPPSPLPTPFKIRMRCVAAPTYHLIQHGEIRTSGTGVKVTPQAGPTTEQKLNDLTVQSYVESFQADNADASESTAQSGSVKRLTMNKSLKIKTVRMGFANNMFKIQARKFRERKPKEGPISLAPPVPYERPYFSAESVAVTVRRCEPKPPTLNYGRALHAAYEDVYDADYFETDDDNVAQIEVLSTPIQKETKRSKKKFVMELGEEEPTTEEIESKLAEVCQKLEVPLAKTELHIGQLINQEPFYKIVNVKKVLKKQKKQQSQDLLRKRLEEIKIGNAHMVIVNPLQHLLDKANIKLEEPTPSRSVRVIPAE